MVVNNLDAVRMPVLPDKANAPLVVDANAVLARPIAFEGFEAVSGWHAQIIQSLGRRELDEFSERHSLNPGGKTPRPVALPNPLRLFATKALNHPFRV